MSVADAHERIKSRIWQAAAQSGLDMSALDKAEQARLVEIAADAALMEADQQLGEALSAGKAEARDASPPTDDFDPDPLEEDVLWRGRPLLSLVTEYVITDERVRVIQGLLGKARDDVELVRIQDVSQEQSMGERMMNIGDITIRSHDPTNPLLILRNVQDPQEVHEILRRAVLNARKKHRFTYREEM